MRFGSLRLGYDAALAAAWHAQQNRRRHGDVVTLGVLEGLASGLPLISCSCGAKFPDAHASGCPASETFTKGVR
jgi:hypothetical protein